MFKFNIGDHVSFVYGSVFSPSKIGVFEAVVNGGKIISRKSSGSSGGPEYRVAGFSGWWAEENLVLRTRASENSPSRDESSGAIKDQGPDSKRDTDENKAEWLHIIDSSKTGEPLYLCSNCTYSALNDYRGRSTASKFCPHCGKYMINHTPEEEDEE